jgi:hypothetical protein
MAARKPSHQPSMSDEAVKAKTGKDWAEWFKLLDAAKAQTLEHRAIVTLLSKTHGVPGWWRQMVAVEYEHARGLREVHQKSDGFSVSASKTVTVALPRLYRAAATDAQRKRWFPAGTFVASSVTLDKYVRGAWNKSARLEFGFYAKGSDKAQITVQVNKLASARAVEHERAAWKAALAALDKQLTGAA